MPNIIGLGLDATDIPRIADTIARYGDRFLNRIFTEREVAYSMRRRQPAIHFAGRFAAKEAILKALGTGWRGKIAWTDIEISNDAAGAPAVALSGECARIAARLGIERILLSITHTDHYAAASAIGIAV